MNLFRREGPAESRPSDARQVSAAPVEGETPRTAATRVHYHRWKRYGLHLQEYASEGLETATILFAVVGIVSLLFAPASPLAGTIPSLTARLGLVGLVLGGVSWLIALSPPGRLSGAHLNPAFSLGLWVLGKMHGRDLAGYIVFQLLGAVVGAEIGTLVFGLPAQQVHGATLHPGAAVGTELALGEEALATLILTGLIYLFLSHERLQHYIPPMVMLMLGVLIAVDGNASGCGLNPARWFGPAAVKQDWGLYAIYTVGPVLGALIAAGGLRLSPRIVPKTGKVVHDARYRSIFKGDAMPSTPPASVHQAVCAEEG